MWTINNRRKCQNTKTMLYSKIKSFIIDRITKEWNNIPLCHHVKMELQLYIRVYIEYSFQNGNRCVCVYWIHVHT